MKTILLLGATSHVAKNLIFYLHTRYKLVLFARDTDKIKSFLVEEGIDIPTKRVMHIQDFNLYEGQMDAIINCVGFGTPEKVRSAGIEQFLLTEKYDNLILDVLTRNPETRYVNFSSGAIYGTDHEAPIDKECEFKIRLDTIQPGDYYRISKLNSEAKHRSLPDLCIFDLRLFSFFSRFIELDSSYLICDMVNTIREGGIFETAENDIVRDYIHPEDLCLFIVCCLEGPSLNLALDVYSAAPVKKSELIDFAVTKYRLQTKYLKTNTVVSPTGLKQWYASMNHAAEKTVSFAPGFSSMAALADGMKQIIGY